MPGRLADEDDPGANVTDSLVTIIDDDEPLRAGDGGRVRRFYFTSCSISLLQAQIDAEKAARAKGLTPWAVISIGDDE